MEEDQSDLFDAVFNTPDAANAIKNALKKNDSVEKIQALRQARLSARNNVKLDKKQCSDTIKYDLEYAQIICSEDGYSLCHDRKAAAAECAKKFKFFLAFKRNSDAEKKFVTDVTQGVSYYAYFHDTRGLTSMEVPAKLEFSELGYTFIKPIIQRIWTHDPTLTDDERRRPPLSTRLSPLLGSKDVTRHLTAVISALKEEAEEIERYAPNKEEAKKFIRQLKKDRHLQLWPSALGDELDINDVEEGEEDDGRRDRVVTLFWVEEAASATVWTDHWEDVLPFYY